MANTIRLASYEDAPTLIELMRKLAKFEKMEASFRPSLKKLQMFLKNAEEHSGLQCYTADNRLLHAWIAEDDDGHAVGFAMGFYGGFSSFAASWEFCLHGLFMHPEVRHSDLSRQFFQHITNEVCEYVDIISFEVLDWNESAIILYERLGAYHYGRRIERNGTTWIPMKIRGEAFWALQEAHVEAIQDEDA